jgi:predicted transcriptional regulator of viral defense system
MHIMRQVEADQDLIVDMVRMRYLLRSTSDVRGKIARMLKSNDLIQLRRGLYASRRNVEPRCLAGSIYGPSYVSFETALAWHGMIPEAVTEILSATSKRGVAFENVFGRFRYIQIPEAVYPIGIQRITDSEVPFLLASATKALCDRIAREPGFRSMVDVAQWLEGMRIDLETGLDPTELKRCAENYRSPAVRWLRQFTLKKGLVE